MLNVRSPRFILCAPCPKVTQVKFQSFHQTEDIEIVTTWDANIHSHAAITHVATILKNGYHVQCLCPLVCDTDQVLNSQSTSSNEP